MRVESCRDGEGVFLLIVQIYIMVFDGVWVQYSQYSDTTMRVESCRDVHCSDLYYGVQWGWFGVLPVSHSDAIATFFIGVLQTLTITAKPKTLHSQTLPLRQETP